MTSGTDTPSEPSEGLRDEPRPLTREVVNGLTYRNVLHYGSCSPKHSERWRVNGMLKTWVTRPEEFQLPLKHGLRDYGYVNAHNVDKFHLESECPYA